MSTHQRHVSASSVTLTLSFMMVNDKCLGFGTVGLIKRTNLRFVTFSSVKL